MTRVDDQAQAGGIEKRHNPNLTGYLVMWGVSLKATCVSLDKTCSSAFADGRQPTEQLRAMQLVMTVEKQNLVDLA
jgi:hypothetical protein